MGSFLSFLNFSKHLKSISNLNNTIKGNWFLYFNFLFKFFFKSIKSKSRFDLFDIDLDGDPFAIGLLPNPQEWTFECPSKNKAENLLIYGTNTCGQYLVIEIKWRPKNTNKIHANFRLIFKDENQVIYELNENHLLNIESNTKLKRYRIGGLNVQIISPYRKLRVRFRGILRRRDTNKLIFSRLNFFWSPLSNIFDFQNDFDDYYLAKEFSAQGIDQIKTEDRHEQWGHLNGKVEFENERSKEVFLWGNKSKQYLNDFTRKMTRIYGFDDKCLAFSVGTVHSTENIKLRYGYVSLGTGCVYPISNIDSTFGELKSFGRSESMINKFKLEIEMKKREFDIEIEKKIDEFENLIIYEMKLNGHNGRCLVITEEFNEIINDFIDEQIEETLPKDEVISISNIRATNVALSGGKGASLAALTQLANKSESKYFVPKGIIVTTNAYQVLIEESQLINNGIGKIENVAWSNRRENLQQISEEFTEMFAKQKFPKYLVEKIVDNLKNTFGDNYSSIRFAVRSSALTEDSGEMSSAGQMTTILGVKGLKAISDAVMKCWSSQFSFVAVEYKRGYGQEINTPMAVVIQEMVNSDTAGVIFTCDPITGDERNVYITANYGIGESVVSALAEPDTIKLKVNVMSNSLLKNRSIKGIEKIEIGSKLKSIILNDNNESGTKGVTNSDNKKCCLSDELCTKLGDIALQVHHNYGDPRDIEWGIKDNKIYLLQSRPITNLDNWTEWEAMHDMDSGHQSESEYLTRANVGEVFPGASSYLCLSWLINIANVNRFQMDRIVKNLSRTEFSVYYNKTGAFVNNQFFLILKSGTFPFVGDPNSTISKSIQMGMFGHTFGDEFSQMINDSMEKKPKKSLPFYIKIWLFFASIKYFLTPGITLSAAKLDVLKMDLFTGKFDFTAKDIFYALMSGYGQISSIYYSTMKTTICSMMYNLFMLEILKKENPNNENECYTDFSQLVASTSQVVSAQVPNRLNDIANSIQNKQNFKSMSDEKALKYLLNTETEAGLKFKNFLLEYGNRGYKEYDPMALQWGDNPIPIIKTIKSMMNFDQRMRQLKEKQSIDEIISSMKTKLSIVSKLLLKYLVIPWCRSGIILREQSKHHLTRSNNIYRHGFWRLAEQMLTEGRIPDPELMFHMTVTEIQTLLIERDATIIARARLRKKLHPIKENLIFDEITIGPRIKSRNESTKISPIPVDTNLFRIKGTPITTGKIEGRCCVAMTLEEAQNIQSGDILITYSTDIAWSPFYPMLSGLATEIGGLISHGAVIAREYSLPCLVGVEGAHRLFKTGDIVVIDSNVGEIYKIE